MAHTTFSRAHGKRCLLLALTVLSCSVAVVATFGIALGKESVLSSPHNLSASGSFNPLFFAEELRVCIFCHAPHNAQPIGDQDGIPAPLWNRNLPTDTGYTPYGQGSTTLKANVSPVPTGASRLCLSCHDGSIALNSYRIPQKEVDANADPTAVKVFLPANRPSNLSKDLSNDHPISFLYDDNLVNLKKGELAAPAALPAEVKLDQAGNLQCTTCHDPHNNEFGKFLVMSNSGTGSPLCATCHTYNPSGANPGWSGTPHYAATIASPSTNGCMNCHSSHNAIKPERLLHYVNEEDNCLANCHNSGLNSLPPLFSLTYRHPVEYSNNVHDEGEPLPAETYHVECVDCHNPHRAAPASPSPAPPNVDGPLYGVRKNTAGDIAATEFEVCYNCHAGTNAWKFTGANSKIHAADPVNRRSANLDQSRRFDSGNPSIHPVAAVRSTTNGNMSLLNRAMTRIYCCDCHGSEVSAKAGYTGANGPHASTWEHILMARYDTPSAAQYPYQQNGDDNTYYALCYRCHDRIFIMVSGTGFAKGGINQHKAHVQDRGVPCFVCHDPHGVPTITTSGPAGTTTNNAHLINLNTDYAGPAAVYSTGAPNSGSCTVSCHSGGAAHAYP